MLSWTFDWFSSLVAHFSGRGMHLYYQCVAMKGSSWPDQLTQKETRQMGEQNQGYPPMPPHDLLHQREFSLTQVSRKSQQSERQWENLRYWKFDFSSSQQQSPEAGPIFPAELSPCWNFSTMNFLCLSVNLALLEGLPTLWQRVGHGGCFWKWVEDGLDIVLQVSVHTPQLLYGIKCLIPTHACVAALMSVSEMSEHSLLPDKWKCCLC